MKIIYVFGASGVGKDTVAKMLQFCNTSLYDAKFSRPFKREVEKRYSLPEGMLEYRTVKNHPVVLEPVRKTFIDVLVESWVARKEEANLPQATWNVLSQCKEHGLTPVFTDCRNQREMLCDFYDCLGIWVWSDHRGEVPKSDIDQTRYYGQCHSKHSFANLGTLPELMRNVQQFHDLVVEPWLLS